MAILGDPQIDLIAGVVLLIMGLVLAFFGKLIWATMMAMIGSMIGFLLGFILGTFIGGIIVALVLAFIFMIIFSLIFGYLVELGLALILGLMGFALVYFSFREANPTAAIIGGAVVLAIIFAVSYYFIEEVIAVATALIGGILAGIGVFLLSYDGGLSIGVGLMIFVFGSLVQIFFLRKHRMRRGRAANY